MTYLYLSLVDVISLLVVIFSGEILNFVIWSYQEWLIWLWENILLLNARMQYPGSQVTQAAYFEMKIWRQWESERTKIIVLCLHSNFVYIKSIDNAVALDNF
jgi:hypothetical protein